MKLGLFPISIVAAFALAGCAHQDATPAPATSMTPPPPNVTSAPLPPPAPPPPASHHQGPPEENHVYKFDFVLTPKDPKDATLTPTTFSVSIREHSNGEVMIGKNVPLSPIPPAPPPGDKTATPIHSGGVPRSDVGLRVKAHPEPLDGSTDLLVDVDLELSSLETGGSIRKVTAHGTVVATPGKSTLVVSLDDDKRHYDLTMTPTKMR